jgi:hypothetical protein
MIGYDSVCRRIASNGPCNSSWDDDAPYVDCKQQPQDVVLKEQIRK